jgi:uncharacterized protein YvpB
MTFYPDKLLSFGTEYQIRLKAGIKSVNGSDSASEYGFSFTTAPEEFSIKMPYYRQETAFTCNIAAARMLLAFRGINISENGLKTEIGTSGSRGNGNPHLGYTAEYGTYWEPVAKTVSKYRPYRLFENWTLSELLREIVKGNPVMIWGQNGWSDPHEISWTNPDGTRIYAINGMHSYVVRGFVGTQADPTEILVNDPWRGITSISTAEFIRRWNYFKTALVLD